MDNTQEDYFIEFKPRITKVIPVRDELLVTGDVVIRKEDDLLDKKESTALKFIQEVLAVGPNVSEEIRPGDFVMIDTSFTLDTSRVEKSVVIIEHDIEHPKFIIPSRYVICKVEWTDETNLM